MEFYEEYLARLPPLLFRKHNKMVLRGRHPKSQTITLTALAGLACKDLIERDRLEVRVV